MTRRAVPLHLQSFLLPVRRNANAGLSLCVSHSRRYCIETTERNSAILANVVHLACLILYNKELWISPEIKIFLWNFLAYNLWS